MILWSEDIAGAVGGPSSASSSASCLLYSVSSEMLYLAERFRPVHAAFSISQCGDRVGSPGGGKVEDQGCLGRMRAAGEKSADPDLF